VGGSNRLVGSNPTLSASRSISHTPATACRRANERRLTAPALSETGGRPVAAVAADRSQTGSRTLQAPNRRPTACRAGHHYL